MTPPVKDVTTSVLKTKSTVLKVVSALTDLTESTEFALGAPSENYTILIARLASVQLALIWFTENACLPAEEMKLELKDIVHVLQDSTSSMDYVTFVDLTVLSVPSTIDASVIKTLSKAQLVVFLTVQINNVGKMANA